MRSTLLLLALLAASAVAQQRLIKGCLTWSGTTCNACYQRQVTSKGCGPLLPVTNTCLIHGEQPGQKTKCLLCKPGYGITNQGSCAPNTVFGCVFGGITPQGTSTCIGCGSGQYPTPEATQCAPLATGGIDNCLWGGRSGSQLECLRCNPGFGIVAGQQACVALNAGTTGCWIQSTPGACQVCDVIAGYSMQKNGQCKFIKKE